MILCIATCGRICLARVAPGGFVAADIALTTNGPDRHEFIVHADYVLIRWRISSGNLACM